MSIFLRGVSYLYDRFVSEGGGVVKSSKKVRVAENISDVCSVESLFLITPGRSGTKSLVDFCKSNTSLYSVHAPTPWLASVGFSFHQGSITPDAARYAFYSAREKYLKDSYERDLVFFDGDCKNLPISLEIARLMPNSKFVHLVRDPRAFIKSGLARGYYQDKPCAMWGHLLPNKNYEFSNPVSQVEKIAYFWNEANNIAEQAKAELGAARVLTIRAEDMFNDSGVACDALKVLGFGKYLIEDNNPPSFKRLNVQKSGIPSSREALVEIERAIEAFCLTRTNYKYD